MRMRNIISITTIIKLSKVYTLKIIAPIMSNFENCDNNAYLAFVK